MRAYFKSDPIKGERSPRGKVALQMPFGYQISGDYQIRVMHLWSQKVKQGQFASTGGQIALKKKPYGYHIWYKKSLTKVSCISGVKGHAGVNQR